MEYLKKSRANAIDFLIVKKNLEPSNSYREMRFVDTRHIQLLVIKIQCVFVKHGLCPRWQQSPKKLFLEQRSKSRSQGH